MEKNNEGDKIRLADIPSDLKNFKNLSQNKRYAYIGWLVGIIIAIFLFNVFGGHSYSQEEQEMINNAERGIGMYLSNHLVDIPASDIEYSVYKVEGSKCILKCKSNNTYVVNAYGDTFYGGYILNSDYSCIVHVSSDLSEVKNRLGW